jgi:hypothetical protein
MAGCVRGPGSAGGLGRGIPPESGRPVCLHPVDLQCREGRMKRISTLLAVAVLAAAILSGCVIVPVGGWHGDGWHPHHYGRGYRSYSSPGPYRYYDHR